MADRINFQRLNDGKTWGVKIQSTRPDSRHMQGKDVDVPKRGGGYSRVTLGSIEQKWSYARTLVTVYRIAGHSAAGVSALRRNAQAEQRRREAQREETRRALVEAGTGIRTRLAQAEAELANYDPADFEWFDGETEIQEAHEAQLRRTVAELREGLAALRQMYREQYGSRVVAA